MEDNLEELTKIVREADNVVKEEFEKAGLDKNAVEVMIVGYKTVGIKGDKRVYGYPIFINYSGKIPLEWDFIGMLSTRITNEIYDIVRVNYTLAKKQDSV